MQPVAAAIIPEDEDNLPMSMGLPPIRQPSQVEATRPRRMVSVGSEAKMIPIPSSPAVTIQVAIAIAMPSQHSSHRYTSVDDACDHQDGPDESDRLDYNLGLYRCTWLRDKVNIVV
jgi:hypothetical protein